MYKQNLYLQKLIAIFTKRVNHAQTVATFIRSGYPEAQEVKIDLLFVFMTS
jgi:hypothetical protein